MLICLVIPYFDHLEQFQKILPRLVAEGFPLVVVDDASPKHSYEGLKLALEETAPHAKLVRHDENQGKGGRPRVVVKKQSTGD